MVAERLREIAAPTPVVAGERDRPGIHAQCKALAAGIPGAGHTATMHDPVTFNAAVLEFLARV